MIDQKLNYSKTVNVQDAYDVVVCGGGPAGCASALSAARSGLKVLLIEGTGQLGGMATSGHVTSLLAGRTQEGDFCIGGIFKELCEEMQEKGYAIIPDPELTKKMKYTPFYWYRWFIHGIYVEPFQMSWYLDEKMADAGVDVLFFTQFVDVQLEDDRITHVIISNKDGLSAVPAKAVVDATGDADVAFRSGCETVKGRKEDSLMASTTLCFSVYDVDQDELTEYINKHDCPKFRKKIKELKAAGEWPFPTDIWLTSQLTQKGAFTVNTSRLIGVDGTDGRSLTKGMVEGRQQTKILMEIFRKHFPGFQNVKLKSIGSLLGVRETRRIVADFILTIDDVVSGRDFEDCIGFSMYNWDLPNPKKPSAQEMFDDSKGYDFDSKFELPVFKPLPYKMMVPRPINNLICAGRITSVERQVLGITRDISPAMAMGEAAGVAAKLAIQENTSFSEINISQLTDTLRQRGCIIDRAALPESTQRNDFE